MSEEKVLTLRRKKAVWAPVDGATSWNDLTDKPFDENGAIMPEALPEGYPYKEASEERFTVIPVVTITNGTHSDGNTGFVMYQDGECVIVFDGVEYPTGQDSVTSLQFGDPNFVDYPFYAEFVFQGGGYTEYTITCGEGTHQFELYYVVATETIHPMTEEFVRLTSPNGTKYQLTVADDGTLSTMIVL